MEKSLLIVERIVLESLEKGTLSLEEIQNQSGLSTPLLKAVLFGLINRGVVRYGENHYNLNWGDRQKWLPLVKSREGMKAEIKELFSSLVNIKYEEEEECTLKVQKVWLSPDEKEDLDRRLKDIDFFLENIKEKRKTQPVRENISKRQVLFYGASSYDSLVQTILKAG
jgi:Trp operon repressor